MQFNLVNDHEQVVQFVWRGVAWRGVALRCMALALGFTSVLGEVPAAFVAWACSKSVVCFSRASLGSFSGQRRLCILGVRLRMFSWQHAWLSVRCGGARVLVFPLPPLPIQGSRRLSSIVFFFPFPLNSLFSVTGA